ncbi:MAG: oxidoreductase [Streptosporangiaceae bacterium]
MPWTVADIPDQTGRTVVVTGANSGLGLITCRELARRGARVIMTARDTAKGELAADGIRSAVPSAQVEVAALDLADLASVREFAGAFDTLAPDGLDLLVNNAGVMAVPRRTTADGFELQFGTNHLGHFALTGLLLPALLRRTAPRVVTVSSGVHKAGRMNFDDLQGEKRYRKWGAYAQSKLANLLFAFELDRRAEGSALVSLAAHPGYASTNLQGVGPAMSGSKAAAWVVGLGNSVLAQSADMGALPQLYAATSPEARGGTYIGPDRLFEQRGHPKVVSSTKAARDPKSAERLWRASEELTGIHYPDTFLTTE